ncbi:MAG: hypothetical protein JRG96_21425, partial [Deltaproteobacteria bacterium]|nr:hypothetical protein [Deltaproteobacteria bacterium]
MLFEHPGHPGRGVRLAYCMNLHPASDLEGVLEGMRTITLPLAERLGAERLSEGFGVGMYLPADVALALTVDEGAEDLARLVEFLQEHRLDAFTFNAFPYGGFHEAGLKESVFRPTWKSPERVAFTLAVARIAGHGRGHGHGHGHGHVSISTHTGMFGAWIEGEGDRLACAENMALCALDLAQLEEEQGLRVVLALEPEPRSLVNDTGALPAHFERIRVRAREVLGRGHSSMRELSEEIVRQHIGTCLDTCHAAVEFEAPADALANATTAGTPLGKIQFSSALALEHPAANAAGREIVFGMAEPVYLHQVTGRLPGGELARV